MQDGEPAGLLRPHAFVAKLALAPRPAFTGSMGPEMTSGPGSPIADAHAIFAAALARVDPLRMMEQTLRLDQDLLRIETETESRTIDLGLFRRILVFGAGKASARMGRGLEALLRDRIDGGVVVVKTGHTETLSRIRLMEAAHPVPDATSLAAARALLHLGRDVDQHTLLLGLTSGGGSALLCAPSPGLGLEDKQAVTGLLLGCGASIREMNCVRKHLSAIKGGHLAAALAPATVLNLILSDVLGDDLSAIASGPTVPDPTTFDEALGIVQRYGILERLPGSVRRHLEEGARGERPETPKPGQSCFERSHNIIIGSNAQAVRAAHAKAQELGYAARILDLDLSGEAREAGRSLLIEAERSRAQVPVCLLCGGETTVTLSGDGRGGRNQELALAALAETEEEPARIQGITLLSAGTDGSDGPTDAAGAFAHAGILATARAQGLSAKAFLDRNDSYTYFEHLGGHLKTGPTNTNVCDVQIILVTPAKD